VLEQQELTHTAPPEGALRKRDETEHHEQARRAPARQQIPVAAKKPVRAVPHPRSASVALSLAIVLLANAALQVSHRYWDAASDDYGGTRRMQRCESLSRRPDVLFLGSSRVVYGVRPAVVDATVAAASGRRILSCNAAALGSTIEQDYYTLKRFVEDGFLPKLIVENIWEQNLNANARDPADRQGDHIAQILELADLSDRAQLHTQFDAASQRGVSESDFVAQKLIPLYRYRTAILRQVCGSLRLGPCGKVAVSDLYGRAVYRRADSRGCVADPDPPPGTPSLEQQTGRHRRDAWYFTGLLQNFATGGHQPEYLARLIALAHQHGAGVVLVTSPLHPSFFDYLAHPTDWHMISSYLHTVAATHGATYYDASSLPGFTGDDFADQHHLSPSGAMNFPLWLASHVVAPASSLAPPGSRPAPWDPLLPTGVRATPHRAWHGP